MRFSCSPLRRTILAVALALALTGCAARETVPSAMMLSGGGEVSDQGTAIPEEPDSSGSDSETPSFQELPSSEEPSQSSQSSGAPAPSTSSSEASSSQAPSSQAPAVSSSQVPSSQASSSQAPAVSSSQPEEDEEDEEPEDPSDDEDEEGPDDKDDHDYEEEDDPDEDEPSNWSGTANGWEDLKVKYNGSTVSDSAVSIVARIVQNEVGSSFPDEAIKAQAVAAYTFVRYHNLIAGDIPSVGMATASDKVTRLVREVAGEQISYNGKPILATYCAISAGTTTSSQSVWGSHLPYLVPVESEGDKVASGYKTAVTKTASEVQTKLENALGIDLDGVNPKDWFDILSYWDKGPYVNKVSIAGRKETSGRVIRESILGLRSAAFEVAYDKGSDKFTFTTYGYGHGVGMSQMGAKYYADQGWDYVDILEHYYTGTTVG